MSTFAINRRQLLQTGGIGGLAVALSAMSSGAAHAAPQRQTAGGPQITDLGPAVVQFSLMSSLLVGDTVYIGSRNLNPVRIIGFHLPTRTITSRTDLGSGYSIQALAADSTGRYLYAGVLREGVDGKPNLYRWDLSTPNCPGSGCRRNRRPGYPGFGCSAGRQGLRSRWRVDHQCAVPLGIRSRNECHDQLGCPGPWSHHCPGCSCHCQPRVFRHGQHAGRRQRLQPGPPLCVRSDNEDLREHPSGRGGHRRLCHVPQRAEWAARSRGQGTGKVRADQSGRPLQVHRSLPRPA